jgi:hypothetical protein
MAKTLATRTAFSIAKTYGSAVTMSAITNASEAVATLASGHSVQAGDYLEITSGWGRLNGRIVRAKSVSSNDITLEGMNTVSTTNYPSGTGTGSIRRITAWDQLSQVKNVSTSGGDQQFADATSIEDDVEVKIPTIKSARTMTLEVFDDPTLAWYSTVSAADASATPVGVMIAPPNGSKIVANAYWGLQREPGIQKNEVMTSTISLNFAAPSMRYAS